MKKLLPSFLKPFIRFIYYKEERAKIFRELKIKKKQNELIKEFDPDAEKIIVFLIMGADRTSGKDKISGGAISIVSLCEESRKLRAIHSAEVIMCTFPKENLFLHHTRFKNSTTVFRYEQLQTYFKKTNSILFHIPEFLAKYFLQNINSSEKKWLKKAAIMHLNILNQNIRLMPAAEEIQHLKNFASEVTITTAHQQYCTQYYREFYNVPLHKFSVWISPEKYSFKEYESKENLIVVSPDNHEMKEKVISKFRTLKNLTVQIIQNLTYEQYKAIISKAKWAITFGEGLDGYIIEPVFSGAIGFAVYNEQFFTPDFKQLSTIYPSYEEMVNKIVEDIAKHDCPHAFSEYQKKQYSVCAKHYNYAEYVANISGFYRRDYTYK